MEFIFHKFHIVSSFVTEYIYKRVCYITNYNLPVSSLQQSEPSLSSKSTDLWVFPIVYTMTAQNKDKNEIKESFKHICCISKQSLMCSDSFPPTH